jgi:hypothetical protein
MCQDGTYFAADRPGCVLSPGLNSRDKNRLRERLYNQKTEVVWCVLPTVLKKLPKDLVNGSSIFVPVTQNS